MDNKLTAIILLIIGSLLVGQDSIIVMVGMWVMFWAYRFWTSKQTTINVTVPEDEPMEMDAERQ